MAVRPRAHRRTTPTTRRGTRDEIDDDRTCAALAYALPDEATVCVHRLARADRRSADPSRRCSTCSSSTSAARGAASCRRLYRIRTPTPSRCRPTAWPPPAAASGLCCSRPTPWGPPRPVAVARIAARRRWVARHSGVPVGSWAGVGRLLRSACGRPDAAPRPRRRRPLGAATTRSSRSSLVDQIVGPPGPQSVADRAAPDRLPGRTQNCSRRSEPSEPRRPIEPPRPDQA